MYIRVYVYGTDIDGVHSIHQIIRKSDMVDLALWTTGTVDALLLLDGAYYVCSALL